YTGGLGFGQKWMMGWMHDTLKFFQEDPINRKYHHDTITFSQIYAFSENFMLPFSHDEVVHGKASLINKMPGDEWQKFANLRLMYSYMYTHPGTKLLFMGGEFAQTSEWNFKGSLDWQLLEYPLHSGMSNLIKKLNSLYRKKEQLFELQFEQEGFEWVDIGDRDNSIISYFRKSKSESGSLLVVHNFTPVLHEKYTLGLPEKGNWKEIFNSDHEDFGGAGNLNKGKYKTKEEESQGKPHSLEIILPPLACIILEQK
ncbi:MAG: 1,4-alpha-glucan branching enzyme, partial [Saprospiraceae bacterium]|nr:1,4-alpha-glucan branching enzyme [Saprospiraceae bacterium]